MPTQRGTLATDVFETGAKKLDVRDKIIQLQPDETPYFQLVAKAKPEVAVDTSFYWWEDDLLGWYTTSSSYLATDTTITVSDSTIFKVGDVIKNARTFEMMLITDINYQTHVLSVTRAWGTTSASAGNSGDHIIRVSHASQEGASVPESITTQKARLSNYTQIFKRTIKITRTASHVATWGGDRRNYERRKQAVELKADIERQFLFGEPKEDTTVSPPRRQTGGLIYFINSHGGNIYDANNTALTESNFDSWLRDMFQYSSDAVYLLTSSRILGYIEGWAKPKLSLNIEDKKYGFRVSQYLTSWGEVYLVLSRHFTGPYAGWAVGVRPDKLRYRYLEGSDFKLVMDAQQKTEDTIIDYYLAEIGLEVQLAKVQGLIKNVA